MSRQVVIVEEAEEGHPLLWALAGFLGGAAVGALVYSQQVHQHSTALFSRSPLRRALALGYLRGRPSVDTVRLLRDYIAWESNSRLRRRALDVLRCVEEDLD